MNPEQFDQVLLSIASQHTKNGQGIEGLLETFFGFLARKTDFFTGAEQGAAEAIILKSAEKIASKSSKVREKRAADKKKRETQRKKQLEREASLRKKADEESARREAVRKAKGKEPPIAPATSGGSGDGPSFEIVDEEGGGGEGGKGGETKKDKTDKNDEENEEEDEEEEEEEQGPPLIGNGGTNDNYRWTQTLKEVSVFVPVRAGLRSKHLTVEYTRTRIKVGVKGDDELIINGEFFNPIRTDDCTWTIEDSEEGREIAVYMVKDNQMEWWKSICKVRKKK